MLTTSNSADWDLDYSWGTLGKKIAGSAIAFDTNRFDTNWVTHPVVGLLYYSAARANRLGAGHALVPVDTIVDSLGQAHVRYQQTYRGIPVFEGEAIVHVDLASRTVLDVTDARGAFLGRASSTATVSSPQGS